jgi:hypothetical protein
MVSVYHAVTCPESVVMVVITGLGNQSDLRLHFCCFSLGTLLLSFLVDWFWSWWLLLFFNLGGTTAVVNHAHHPFPTHPYLRSFDGIKVHAMLRDPFVKSLVVYRIRTAIMGGKLVK